MNNYPIGDFITRLKNAAKAGRVEVPVPYSRIKENMAKVLLREGYLTSVKKDVDARVLIVTLAYKQSSSRGLGKLPLLTSGRNISKPGARIYSGSREIPRVAGGIGVTLISTSSGVMSDKEAKKKGLGGEVIAQVW